MKRLVIAIVGVCFTLSMSAQPAKSRVTQTQNNAQTTTPKTSTPVPTKTTVSKATVTRSTNAPAPSVSRASIMFPTTVEVPTDVVWRRDIYRELDLSKDANAPLYYPVEPQDGRVNLFTLLFQLLNTGKIPAYTYDTSGLENFNKENRMHFIDMLERYEIPFEVDDKNKTITVNPIDIPSNDVLTYFVKESSYYDQHTATYHSRVVALCPVMHRSGGYVDFNSPSMSADVQKSPLFWVKMEDIEPYLSQNMVMTSNINNAATMSMADFFETNKYKGTIYMTTNMQGKSLAQMVGDSSQMDFDSDSAMFDPEVTSQKALEREQTRIEKEISDFEKHIWAAPVDSVALARQDSIAAAEATSKKAKKTTSTRTTARQTTTKAEKTKKEKSPSSSSSAPRVSVRRERH
ncbi:MAG: gliding motility protein GldN [Bacteroidaceae bacterium]|nr:gliding motility protein GldN [Bacteroidaceae bacterium]